MNFRDSSQGSTEKKYISKKVLINGQFVTLYSLNGQTWLSSPEDIPALMDRLDNARVTLNAAEKVAEGEDGKLAGAEAKDKKEKKPEAEAPERVLATKYRMKGPKPRPILRQDGVVIKGTPIEPISASGTVMSFSSDVIESAKKTGAKSAQSTKLAKDKAPKIIAPVAPKKPSKGAAQTAAAKRSADKKKVISKHVEIAAETKAQAKVKPVGFAKEKIKTKTPVKQQVAKKAPVKKVASKGAAKKAVKAASRAKTKAAKTPQKAASKAKKLKR